jgi:hypothetical protein
VTRSFFQWLHSQDNEEPRTDKLVIWNGTSFVWVPEGGRLRYITWCRRQRELHAKSLFGARDAILWATKATWWKWDGGSTPFFWRWPEEYVMRIRNGVPVYFINDPPLNRKPQRPAPNAKVRELMREKLKTVRDRNYIGPGPVPSLTPFFHVDKGTSDIWIVHDGTASGLIDSIWVPGFGLPTINLSLHLRAVGPTTYMADIVTSERCFLTSCCMMTLDRMQEWTSRTTSRRRKGRFSGSNGTVAPWD